MRKLATIRAVSALLPIEGADAIEVAQVDGWKCVVKKGEFQQGDLGVYFEIDSFLPALDPRFAFLEKQFTTFDGKEGARLRTIRLRKQLSQGLILPLKSFPELSECGEGEDVTEMLDVVKWEPPVSARLHGEVFGNFPHFIPKTDQPRIQNMYRELKKNVGEVFEVTVKLDGSSLTVYKKDEHYGVCSRNLEIKPSANNTMWNMVYKYHLHRALATLEGNYAFQGEIIGEGIQGNPEKIHGQDFYVYDIYDIDKQEYLSPLDRMNVLSQLTLAGFDIKHVPCFSTTEGHEYEVVGMTLQQEDVGDVDYFLSLAEGPSLNPNVKREGLVFKRMDGQFSFKVISNSYLEKNKDR